MLIYKNHICGFTVYKLWGKYPDIYYIARNLLIH